MTWWGTDLSGSAGSFQPKQRSRFIVQMGNGGNLFSVKSIKKPTATIESKQYRMINHFYNYPGLVKWEPITITFVDTKYWGDGVGGAYSSDSKRDFEQFATARAHANPTERMTSHALWEMLIASGYTPPSFTGNDIISPRAKSISSPEKAAMMDLAFGKSLFIHQLHPDGTTTVNVGADSSSKVLKSVETWEIHNPTITKISWGDLDYGDDTLVEYVLDITYDWAVHHHENPTNLA